MSQIFFSAWDSQVTPQPLITPMEPWVTDGTAAGTFMVKDTLPGTADGSPGGYTVSNGMLFFAAYDPNNAAQLWKSDGTTAGTVKVKDIAPGHVNTLTDVNGTLFFVASDATHGQELWKSDGTDAGTMMVKDLSLIHI